MDNKKAKEKRGNVMTMGFIVEVCLFFFSGYFMRFKFLIGLALLFIGFVLAFWVGNKISQDAVINYKQGLK